MLPKPHPRHSSPPSTSGTKSPSNPVKTLNPSAAKKSPPTKTTPSPNAAGASPSSKPVGSPKKTTPSSPQSHGLGATGGVPPEGDSAKPQDEDSPQSIPQVAKILAKDLYSIKVGFHIGRLITAAVNTEAERTDIQALRSDLDFASLRINVSIPFLFYITTFSRS
jgi:hypothetical protein